LKAIATKDRLISSRLEWHLRRISALAASDAVELARTSRTTRKTSGALGATKVPAIRAAIWLVLKTLGCEEFLLARAEDELGRTIGAGQHLISVQLGVSLESGRLRHSAMYRG
jgi:hypothetical protein